MLGMEETDLMKKLELSLEKMKRTLRDKRKRYPILSILKKSTKERWNTKNKSR
jgi:hypothetical protein